MKNVFPDEFTVRQATNRDCRRVKQLVFGILREYALEPDPDGTDMDLADIEAYYSNRGGLFEIIEDGKGNLIGTVGLLPTDSETIELRKMYFAKDLRRKGLGKLTLKRMIEKAQELGYKKIYLETASVLVEAIGLYEKFGFVPVDRVHAPRCDRAYILEI